jgi:hypothetical protein
MGFRFLADVAQCSFPFAAHVGVGSGIAPSHAGSRPGSISAGIRSESMRKRPQVERVTLSGSENIAVGKIPRLIILQHQTKLQ